MPHLRTDHWIDAVISLEAAQEFVVRAAIDPMYWKWTLIAVHSAVQGFMSLALDHGNGLLVMKDDIAEKWLKAHYSDAPYPQEKMDFYLALYEKIKSDKVCFFGGSKKFIATPDHDYSMKKLNELRNSFIHFSPTSWSIDLADLPTVCLNCIDIVHFLGWESRTIFWHNAQHNTRAANAITMLRAVLTASQSRSIDEK